MRVRQLELQRHAVARWWVCSSFSYVDAAYAEKFCVVATMLAAAQARLRGIKLISDRLLCLLELTYSYRPVSRH